MFFLGIFLTISRFGMYFLYLHSCRFLRIYFKIVIAKIILLPPIIFLSLFYYFNFLWFLGSMFRLLLFILFLIFIIFFNRYSYKFILLWLWLLNNWLLLSFFWLFLWWLCRFLILTFFLKFFIKLIPCLH